MNMLVVVLNEADYLEEILDGFVDIGIKGATIFDSQGMGSAITSSGKGHDIFFAGIRKYINDNTRPYNKTVFSVIEDEYILQQAIRTVREIVGDFSKPGVGLMFTIPIGKVWGSSF